MSPCCLIQACIAIPAATPALMRVEPNWAIDTVTADLWRRADELRDFVAHGGVPPTQPRTAQHIGKAPDSFGHLRP